MAFFAELCEHTVLCLRVLGQGVFLIFRFLFSRAEKIVFLLTDAITFYVNDFSQYNALISFLNDNRSYGGDHLWSLFYRGVKDSSYELKSSLRVSGLERYESRIINDLYNLHPHEFEGCKTDFEMIAKMRHYGLPTRFIDFSRNPNIALWVACEEFENKDGLIYVLSSQHDVLPVRMAEILCQFARFDDGFDMIDERAIYNQIGIDNLKYYIKLSGNRKTSRQKREFGFQRITEKLYILPRRSEILSVYGAKEKQLAKQLPPPRNVLETRGIGIHRREAVANVVSRTNIQNAVRDEDAVIQDDLPLDR